VEGRHRIKRFIVHPEYDAHQLPLNDIALAELEQPLSLDTSLQAACLVVESNSKVFRQKQLSVIGFGLTEPIISFHQSPGLSAQIPRLNSYSLKRTEMYQSSVESVACQQDVLCADSMDIFSGVCENDAGGPLHITSNGKSYVIGITSGGTRTAIPYHRASYDCTSTASFNLVEKHLTFISSVSDDFCGFKKN
jgi:secreted trypsin-like serine protease